jgi:hypothetical protein
MLELNQTLSFF